MGVFSFWQKWLFFVSLYIIFFGVAMAFLSGTVVFAWFNELVFSAIWAEGAITPEIMKYQKFMYGVLGATMAGWGVFIAFVARYPFKNKELWAWNCVASGVIVWFLIDSGLSAWFGVYANVALNTIFLLLIAPPIIFTRKHFGERG